MSCQEVTEFLADFLDGELPLRQRLVFRLHLLMCPDCRRYLDSYAATIRLTLPHSVRTRPRMIMPQFLKN